jgi:ketosteroid isomerase-like protein
MTGDEFAQLLSDFTHSAETGDGARFAGHFTEDAVYYDYIYGAHRGRADIAHMMQDLFHRDAGDIAGKCSTRFSTAPWATPGLSRASPPKSLNSTASAW